jgi:hypothetical protein
VRRRSVVLLVVLGLALGLVGCGGGDVDGSGASSSATKAFCSKAKAVDRQFDDLDAAVGPTGVPSAEVLTKAATSLDTLGTSAPTAVRTDLATVASGVRKIADLLGQVNLTGQAALADPNNAAKLQRVSTEMERLGKDVQAASGRVAKYLKDECGIDTGATTSSTTTSTTAATTTTLG